MLRLTLPLLCATLTLMGCTRGTLPTLASPQQPVNLTLPVEALQSCGDAPLARDGKWATLMRNHVAVSAWGHRCSDVHDGLLDALQQQQGITINGASTDRARLHGDSQ